MARSTFQIGAILLCIFAVIAAWVGEAEELQSLQEPTSKAYFSNVYFMTWFVRIAYLGFLPLWIGARLALAWLDYERLRWVPLDDAEKRVLKHSPWLTIFFWMSGYTWYLSLPLTSVAGNTIVFNLGPVIVLPLSVALLGDYISLARLTALVLAIAGMIVVVGSSRGTKLSDGKEQTVGGYVAIFVAMLTFAGFEVLFAKFVGGHGHHHHEPAAADVENEKDPLLINRDQLTTSKDDLLRTERSIMVERMLAARNSLFFLFLFGFWNTFILWAGIPILHYTGLEKFERPSGEAYELMSVAMGLDVTLNIGFLMGIVLTSPNFMALASLLAIPTSVLSDLVLHHSTLTPIAALGTAVIFVGFGAYAAGSIVKSFFLCWSKEKRRRIVHARICNDRMRIF